MSLRALFFLGGACYINVFGCFGVNYGCYMLLSLLFVYDYITYLILLMVKKVIII